MAKDPSFLFYSSDFLTGTMFMSYEETGKYIKLLCSQHQHGGLINKSSFNAIVNGSDILKSKFIETEDGFYNERLMQEMMLRKVKSSNLSANAIKRWKNNSKSNAIALQKHCKSNASASKLHMPIEDEDENEIKDEIKDVNINKNTIKKHELNWKEDYNIYKSEELNAYNLLLNDKDFIEERKKYHPNMDVKLSLEKAHVDFWSTEAGWLYKKKSKTSKIDWKSTYRNALAIKSNQVWGNHGTYKTSVDRVNENQRAILQTGIEAISDLKREREAFGVDSIEAYPINPNLELTYDERPVESVCGDSIGGNDL